MGGVNRAAAAQITDRRVMLVLKEVCNVCGFTSVYEATTRLPTKSQVSWSSWFRSLLGEQAFRGAGSLIFPASRKLFLRMLLTISATHSPATDLGYLLHKNPARVQTEELSFGKAYVFYPEAGESHCTAAILLEVDPVGLV